MNCETLQSKEKATMKKVEEHHFHGMRPGCKIAHMGCSHAVNPPFA